MRPAHTYGMAFLKEINKYKVDIQGVIHNGAHWGQEYFTYEKLGVKDMLFFEPVTVNYKKLIEVLPKNKKIRAFNIALGNKVLYPLLSVSSFIL